MKKYTICICDDEVSFCEQLKTYIVRYSFLRELDLEVIELDSVSKLISEPVSYDILFLDIRFDRDNTGIDVAEQLRERDNTLLIILMSLLRSMIIDGYRAEAFRFLLKPITEEMVHATLTDCFKKINRTSSYIRVLNDSHISLIRTEKIMYIYSKARKRHIVCTSNETIDTWQCLSELMESLLPEKFIFSHKSYIVNLDRVDFVKETAVILTDNTSIPLGTHYKDKLMKKLLKDSK